MKEAIALDVNGVEPERDSVGQTTRRALFQANEAVIADVDLADEFRLETRLRGDDRDQAGRGVPAEQRALRSAQHFDAVQSAKLGQAHARASAINAVDEHADRAFEAGIVADRADAADSRHGCARFRRCGGDEERRRHLVQLPNVGRAGVPKRLRRHRADSHRDVGQRLVPPRRGDHDVAGVDRLLLPRLILHRRTFGSAGCRLSRLLVSICAGSRRLGESRSCQDAKPGRKQPRGLAVHLFSPPRARTPGQPGG